MNVDFQSGIRQNVFLQSLSEGKRLIAINLSFVSPKKSAKLCNVAKVNSLENHQQRRTVFKAH